MSDLSTNAPFPVDENGIRIRLGRDPGLRMQFDGDGGGDGGGGDGGNTGTGDDNTGTGNDDQLGDGGKKALDAERRARSAAEKAASATAKERDDLAKRLADIEASNKTESEKALEKAVREAEERARKEVSATANARLVKASVRVAAAGKLADAEDAVRFLNMDDFKVDDDGEVDDKAIASAIDGLLKEKPYLAGKPGKPQGDVDQGARGGANGDGSVDTSKLSPGVGRLTHAYSQSGAKK